MKITGYSHLYLRARSSMQGQFALLRVEANDRKAWEREIQAIASTLMFVGECTLEYEDGDVVDQRPKTVSVPVSSVLYAVPVFGQEDELDRVEAARAAKEAQDA